MNKAEVHNGSAGFGVYNASPLHNEAGRPKRVEVISGTEQIWTRHGMGSSHLIIPLPSPDAHSFLLDDTASGSEEIRSADSSESFLKMVSWSVTLRALTLGFRLPLPYFATDAGADTDGAVC